jgi:CheY-like chemotaxis protein
MSVNKFILLVEDNELLASLMVTVIGQRTLYNVAHVVDAKSALEIVEQIEPDLLILDYRLPDLTGFELYQRIHEVSENENIPTIFTSEEFPSAASSGARTTRLNKPFALQEFLDTICTLLA